MVSPAPTCSRPHWCSSSRSRRSTCRPPGTPGAVTSGVGLSLVLLVVHQQRAPVRRKPTGPELLFYAGMSAALIVAYVAFSIAAVVAALKFGLPASHTVAAAALALTTLACVKPARRVFASIVRR